MPACSEVDLRRGRYRRIYTTLLTDPRFDALSEAAEVLWQRLQLIADDYGNLERDPALIRAAAAPRKRGWTEKRVRVAVGELERRGLLVAYDAGEESFFHLTGFLALQPANKNGKRFRRFPMAPMEAAESEGGLFRVNPGPTLGLDEHGERQGQVEDQGQDQAQSDARGQEQAQDTGERRERALPASPDAGPGLARVARSPKGFVDVGVLRLCDAFRFNQDQALQQRRSLAAALHVISERSDRDFILDQLVALAKEKRADARIEYPIRAWQAAVKKGAGGYPAEKGAA